uniref:SWIM-type domain-containing protein n=1 Tax=Lactuca sativa TaxID=4236 RepID=A0A9R1XHG7_LACSA|nr:hypothetical protein LSAT_V11C500289790 [Lactuca sativa]
MASPNGRFLSIDFHFNGMFAPSPLVYLDPMRMPVRDVDFDGMDYREFVLWVSKLTRQGCDNLYYYSTDERLVEGIRRIDNDADYFGFIEDGYMDKNELRMNVYIDHQNEPILDWADKEMLTGNEVSEVIEDDDTESQISDIMECEHEPDEEVHTFDKTDGDEFLNKLCGKPIVNSNQEEVNDAADDEVSDEDDEVVFPVFDEKQEWDKMVPVLGMKFSNPLELKLCLTNYAVKNGYDLWFEKNDHQKLLAKCCKHKKNKKNKSCPFRLWATWMKNERSFQIKSLIDRHDCEEYSNLGPLNARKYAFQQIEGTLIEHYAKTWSYGEELKRTNPGSTVKMEVDVMPNEETYFSKFYVCLKGLKDGWIEGCRRVIGIDGCFLKGICRVENKETWKWFLDLLIDDIGMGVGHGLTIISYQHKGLVEVVKERVPAVEHRQCARHICANFKKRFKGQIFKKLFWRAVGSTIPQKFEYHMNEIKKLEPLAYEHLMERDPKTWCKAFFQVDRSCDAYENGISKSFNSVIEAARKKPFITMLKEIRIYVMERLCIYKAKVESWDLNICPSIRLKLNKLKEQQRFWKVVPSRYMQFEVRVGIDGYVVDLHTRQCGCRAWKLTWYPCVHGYAAISSLNRDPEDYVSEWFTTSMERGHNRSTCPQRPNDVLSTSGKVDLEAELEVDHVVMFESESDSEFESESDVEANIEVPEVDVVHEVDANIEVDVVPEVEVDVVPNVEADVPLVQDDIEEEIQDDIEVDAPLLQDDIEEEVQYEVEHDIKVQDNVEQDIQDNAEIQVRKRTRKSSEIITNIMLRKNIRRKEGSSNEHPLEI